MSFMLRKEKNGLSWLEFEIFQEFTHLKHATSLRSGGVSSGSFGSLNMGLDLGDDEKNVTENRTRFIAAINNTNAPTPDVISGLQVHGCHVAYIPEALIEAPTADGLMTNLRQKALFIKQADCQAALFFDPVENAIAAIHSGWKGSVQNIYQKTIDCMRQTFGSKPENMLVAISPSLGPDSSQFINFEKELPQEFLPFQFKPFYFDFWAISGWQLETAGILPHHIEIASIDTLTNPQDYFSFRRDKPTGRHATVIWLI